jgi:hypothetical protein
VVYQYTWDFHSKELIAESPFTFIADDFFSFSAGITALGFPLLADSGNRHTATNLTCSGRPILAIGSIAASLFPLSADWLCAISHCSGRPIEMDKPNVLA